MQIIIMNISRFLGKWVYLSIIAIGILSSSSLITARSLEKDPDEIKKVNNEQVVKMNINNILLFSDQALVERSGQVSIQKGENNIRIKGLPASLIRESINLSFPADSPMRILSIESVDVHEKVYYSDQDALAEKNLRTAEEKLRKLSDHYTILTRENSFLKQLRFAEPLPKKDAVQLPIHLTAWQLSLDFLDNELSRNQNEMNDLLPQIDAARETLTVALAVAEKFRNSITISSKDVLLNVDSKKNESVLMKLSYRVGNAGWYPYYTARVDSIDQGKTGSISLTSYALVKNDTGEDWSDVRLFFSAADPNESAQLPELASWIIRSEFIAAKPRKTGRQMSMRRDRSPVSPMEQRYKADEYLSGASGMADADLSLSRKRVEQYPNQTVQQTDDFQTPETKIAKKTQRSRNYLQSNMSQIRDKRSSKRALAAQENLDALQQDQEKAENMYQRKDYSSALSFNDKIIQSIQRIPAEYQKFFQDDLRKARENKRRAMAMLETQKYFGKLISPQLSARGYDYRYSASQTETIRSDGSFHKIILTVKKLTADLFFEATPEMKKMAFLVGNVQYAGESPLLSGPMSVFHQRDYVGEAFLPVVAPQQNFMLHLGADESIRIVREADSFRVTEGVFSKVYSYRHETRLTIQNRKNQPIDIRLFERYPIAQNDKVKISDVSFSITPDNKNDQGICEFLLKMKPFEKVTLTIKYTLTHDADVQPIYTRTGGSHH